MELIGLLGSICMSLSGIPGAYAAYKNKTCDYSPVFLGMVLVACVLLGVYAFSLNSYILLANYVGTFACMGVISYYNRRL